MKAPRRKFLHLAAGAAALPAVSRIAMAQAYPSRPVRIIVAYAPAGPVDILARIFGERFSEASRQPVVVENISGAGGNVGADRVAKAAPDGYTLLMANTAQIVINPSLYERMPFDAIRDFAPISQVVFTPNILAVHNDVPVKSVSDLVALARSRPGQLTYGSAGVGTSQHLAGELFKSTARLDIQHVPYRGISLAMTDLLGGRITMVFGNTSAVLPLMRENKLRPLAVTSLTRASSASHLPTVAESGFPGYDVTASFGLLAPAGTPPEIVQKLYGEAKRVAALPDIRKRLDELGMEVITNTPDEFAAVIKSETPKWARLIKEAGIKVTD